MRAVLTFYALICSFCLSSPSTAFAQFKLAKPWEPGYAKDISIQREQQLNLKGSWRQELEKAGLVDSNGPYRVALPLASFGHNGPKLLFTYVPRMKDNVGRNVLMFYVKVNLE